MLWYNGSYRSLPRKGETLVKLSNVLQLAGHHRFVVVRRFGVSPLDHKMITAVYQPMIGSASIALYMTLCAALPGETVGVSERCSLGSLFLSCGMEPNERGRIRLMEETSKLEAVGLLETYRRSDQEDNPEYEFRLHPPLGPDLFFEVHHLWLLLQHQVGETAARSLKRAFVSEERAVAGAERAERAENISSPFYEVFRLPVPPGSEAEIEATASAQPPDGAGPEPEFGRDGFRGDELLRRFPRSSAQRRAVERLLADAGQLAELNYYAGRFGLTLKQTAALLDEEGIFSRSGDWQPERFQARAAELFKQGNASALRQERTLRKREIAGQTRGGGPSRPDESGTDAASGLSGNEREADRSFWLPVPEQFAGQCELQQYNALLLNLPYMKVLKLFFEPSAVPAAVEEAFLGMSVNYRLPDEVINVMIHYIRVNDLDWKRNYLDAIGANVAGKRIRTFENAVAYFRKAAQARAGGGGPDKPSTAEYEGTDTGKKFGETVRRGRAPAKPVIPVARPESKEDATEEDIRRILDMAKRLNG